MPYLSDSDDSDNSFLNEAPAFPKRPEPAKRKKTSLETLKQIALGKPIATSEESTNQQQSKVAKKRKRAITNKKQVKKVKPNKQELLRAERQKDPKWIEEQAWKTVNEVLQLDVVDKITALNEIGWCREPPKRGKKAEFYPAIISQNKAESEILLQTNRKKKFKTLRIQYVGVDWNDALKHDEVALSKWIPYASGNEAENQERLQNFIKTISKTSRFKNNPLELKVEEFAVQKMWGKVEQQEAKRKAEEEKEREDAAVSGPAQVTQDSDHSSQHNEQEKADADSDGSSSDDEGSIASPGKKKGKRTALRVNDEIEYYEVMGTFGNPQSLRRARVDGISPGEKFPLQLSNSIMPLPGTHRVRRLPDGFWQPIHDHVLLKEGFHSILEKDSALQKATKSFKKVQADIIRARDKFWKNEHEPKSKQKTKTSQKGQGGCGITNNGGAGLRRSRRAAVRVGRK